MNKLASLLAAAALLALAGPADAAFCGSGTTCFAAPLALSNANDATPVPVVAYTAPASGSGAKITQILAQASVSNLTNAATAFYLVHNGVNYLLFTASPVNLGLTTNMLVNTYTGAPAAENLNTDENGNTFILLSAGDSIAITNTTGIPPSGATSGTYYFVVEGQAY